MFAFYINKQTCVELTETTLSTATISLWLCTNRPCSVVRSRVGGLGLAAVVGGGGLKQSPGVLRLPRRLCACAKKRKRKSIVHVVTGLGLGLAGGIEAHTVHAQ